MVISVSGITASRDFISAQARRADEDAVIYEAELERIGKQILSALRVEPGCLKVGSASSDRRSWRENGESTKCYWDEKEKGTSQQSFIK